MACLNETSAATPVQSCLPSVANAAIIRQNRQVSSADNRPPSAHAAAVEIPSIAEAAHGRRGSESASVVGKKATLDAGKRKLEEFKRKKQAALAAKKGPSSLRVGSQLLSGTQAADLSISAPQMPSLELHSLKQESSAPLDRGQQGQIFAAGVEYEIGASLLQSCEHATPVVATDQGQAWDSLQQDHTSNAASVQQPDCQANGVFAGQTDVCGKDLPLLSGLSLPEEAELSFAGPMAEATPSSAILPKDGTSLDDPTDSWQPMQEALNDQLNQGSGAGHSHVDFCQQPADAHPVQQPAWVLQAATAAPWLVGTSSDVPLKPQPDWLAGAATIAPCSASHQSLEKIGGMEGSAVELQHQPPERQQVGQHPVWAAWQEGAADMSVAPGQQMIGAASELDADISFWDNLPEMAPQAGAGEAWQGWGSDTGDWEQHPWPAQQQDAEASSAQQGVSTYQDLVCAVLDEDGQWPQQEGGREDQGGTAEHGPLNQQQPEQGQATDTTWGGEGQVLQQEAPPVVREVHEWCSATVADSAENSASIQENLEHDGSAPAPNATDSALAAQSGAASSPPYQQAQQYTLDAREGLMQDGEHHAREAAAEAPVECSQSPVPALDTVPDGDQRQGMSWASITGELGDGAGSLLEVHGFEGKSAGDEVEQQQRNRGSPPSGAYAAVPSASPQSGSVPSLEGASSSLPTTREALGQPLAIAEQEAKQQPQHAAQVDLAELAVLEEQLATQQVATEGARAQAEKLIKEKQHLESLLSQVDSERQQLQREKAGMLGELVMLSSTSEQPDSGLAHQEATEAAAQVQQQLREEQQRCAELVDQLQIVSQRAQQDQTLHREQVDKLLARLDAAELAAKAAAVEAAKPSGPAAAETASAAEARTISKEFAELQQECEAVKQEKNRLIAMLEQVDSERQQLQREKAAMVGELISLRTGEVQQQGTASQAVEEADLGTQQAANPHVAELEGQLAEALAQLEAVQQAQQQGQQECGAGEQQLVEAQQAQQQWAEYAQYWEEQANALQEQVTQLEASVQQGLQAHSDAQGIPAQVAGSAELSAWQARCAELESLSEQLRQAEHEKQTQLEALQQRFELVDAQQANQPAHHDSSIAAGAGSGSSGQELELQLEQAHKELAHFGAELADAHAELAEIKAKHAQELTEQQVFVLQLQMRCSELETGNLAAQHAQRQSEVHAAVAEQHAEQAQQVQRELQQTQHAHAVEVAALLADKAGAEQRAQHALEASEAAAAEVASLQAQLEAAKEAQCRVLAELAPLKAHAARLEAEMEALQHVALPATSPKTSGGFSRPEDAGALRTRLDKAELALEKERRALQFLERQLAENQQAADEGRIAVQDLRNIHRRCDELERQLAVARSALQEQQAQAQQLRQGHEQVASPQQSSGAQQVHAAEEQLRLAARAAEERAAASDAVALELRAQCEAAGATLGKLVEENSQLADRLNWQSGEISRLRIALGELEEAQKPVGRVRGGEGASEDGSVAQRQDGSQVWELADGVQLSESEMQLLALAEEVEKLQQALEVQSGRSAQLEAQLRQQQQQQYEYQGQYSLAGGSAPPAGGSDGQRQTGEAEHRPRPQSDEHLQEQHIREARAVLRPFVPQQGQHAAGTWTSATATQAAGSAQAIPLQEPHAEHNVSLVQPQQQEQHQPRSRSSQRKGGFSFWQWVAGADIAGGGAGVMEKRRGHFDSNS